VKPQIALREGQEASWCHDNDIRHVESCKPAAIFLGAAADGELNLISIIILEFHAQTRGFARLRIASSDTIYPAFRPALIGDDRAKHATL
jgi:hypothetical protein